MKRGNAVGLIVALAGGMIAAAACIIAVAGCGGGSRHPSTTASPLAQVQRTHEYPSPRPVSETATAEVHTPVAAVRAFATAYINWTATTIATNLRTLAEQSVGQARSAMTLAAAQAAGDYELQRGGVGNQGTVEAVAQRPAHPDQYVVVTRELTTATATSAYDGLQPAWHVALATVARQPDGGFVVSGWQPES
jgi:hypothetical protein